MVAEGGKKKSCITLCILIDHASQQNWNIIVCISLCVLLVLIAKIKN